MTADNDVSRPIQTAGRHYAVAVGVIAFAAALRIWPLQALGSSLAWLTFYPAVMIAAIYGGLWAGFLATALSCLTVALLWPMLVTAPFIRAPADWLGMGVFVFTGAMISGVAEAMRRANARARKAQAQAEAASRAKSVFLATMSHELRTPLNAILGFSDLMRSDPAASAAQRENLDIIRRSGEHLLNLINDVLDMAKIEAGQIVLADRPFDIGGLLRDIADMMRVRAEESGLQLRLELPSACPRYIRGDEDKLRQAIVNLVGNAIKFTRQGSIALRLRCAPTAPAPSMTIDVEDSGIGIGKADQARIFEPFVQVGQPATQKGTGLGLAIVREFVAMMGGRVGVDSTPGQGSVFRIELPLRIADEADVTPAPSARGEVAGIAPGQPEYRILIVEDQVENQLLLRRLLEDAGFKVEVAENGAQGVRLFERFHPHFIWMDRRMPVMDGLEATRRIRALKGGKDVKIVCVSASVYEDQRAETLAQGMDDFVRKPYRAAEIFECLELHLGVRYLYKAPAPVTEGTTAPALTLAALPADLRQELADALVDGSTERIAGLVRRIGAQDAELAQALMRYLDRFDYQAILRALAAADPQRAQAPT